MTDEAPGTFRLTQTIAPVLALIVFLAILLMILRFPIPLPIGAMYWDVAIYLDAAHRIDLGQIHSVDFSAPVGALGYYLYALGARFLPEAHPLLLAQWTPLVVTAPLMALIIADVAPRSRATGWALLFPFMIFSALPFNLVEYYPYPGVDGFGIYNRQTSHVLYILACALIFVRSQVILAIVAGAAATALFLLKITGFASGSLMFLLAIMAGRIGWGVLLVILVIFYGTLGWLEYETGMIAAYLEDIFRLMQANSESILRRFLTAASVEFKAIGGAGLLVLALLWFSSGSLLASYRENFAYLGRRRALNAMFNAPVSWIVGVTISLILFETQNTGSHGFIALWPAIWLVLSRLRDFGGAGRTVIAALCAVVALPPAVEIVHRAARTAASAPFYIPLKHDNLKTLGLVCAKGDVVDHADALQEHYARHRRAYMDMAEAGQLPSFLLYSEPSFQLVWLRELDRLVSALHAWEQQGGRRLNTVYTADFVNPLAWLTGGEPPRHVQIGADVERTFRESRPEMLAALAATDAILLPRCPETNARLAIRTMLQPVLEGRQAIEITPCYTMMLLRNP